MKHLGKIAGFLILLQFLSGCNGQTTPGSQNLQLPAAKPSELVGGGCDGCELMYAGMPSHLTHADTSAGWTEEGQKLVITGKVFKIDGKTPAPNVIIYYWQTDNKGYYSPKDGMNENASRHGHIRGWLQTDEQGNYAIYTIKPAPYPNEATPAHIHLAIKEPTINNEYYIDDFVFANDANLTEAYRNKLTNRGGSGILQVQTSGSMQIAAHNIILGLNIPNYPTK